MATAAKSVHDGRHLRGAADPPLQRSTWAAVLKSSYLSQAVQHFSIQSRKSSIRLPSDQRMHGCDGDGESNQQNLVMRLARRVMPRPSKKPWWICAGPRLRTAKQCIVDGMRSLAQRPEASGTLRSNHCRSGRDLMAAASSFIRTRIIGKTGRRALFRLAHRADGRRP